MQNDISTKTLMPVFHTTGCVGHLLRTAKGFRACDANDNRSAFTRRSSLAPVVSALPINLSNEKMVSDVGSAVASGTVDMKPVDPIEGMLISQIIAASEAALEFYRRGWTNTAAGYFDGGTKYLQLADKSSRTVALLTERLDQHRGWGQQQITVKHVTVNADQAVVTDQIVADKGKETIATSCPQLSTNR